VSEAEQNIVERYIPPPERILQKKAEPLDNEQQAYVWRFISEDRWGKSRDRMDRADYEEMAHTNTAMFEGMQYGTYDQQRRAFLRRQTDVDESFVVVNMTYKWVRAMLGAMTAERDQWHVIPGKDGDDARLSARYAERLASYLWDHCEMDQKQIIAWNYILVRKMCFWKVTWNPLIGPIGMRPDGKVGPMGDLDISPRDPLTIYPDPNADLWENAQNVTEVTIQHVDWVKDLYDVEIAPEDDITDLGRRDKLGSRMWRQLVDQTRWYAPQSSKRTQTGRPMNLTRLFEYWELPSREFELGRYILTAGRKVLVYTIFPYRFPGSPPRLPYIQDTNAANGWSMYPFAPIDHVIMLNRELNRLRSDRKQRREKEIFPALIIHEDSEITDTAYKGTAGEIIKVAGPWEPKWQAAMPPDHTSLDDLMIIEKNLVDVGGDQPMMHGQNQPNVRSWSQQEGLLYQSIQKLIPDTRLHERAMSRALKYALQLCRIHMDPERAIQTIGDDGRYQFFKFGEANIADDVDIRVQSGAILSRTKSQQRAMVFELLQNGFFTLPPSLQERVGQLIGFKDIELLLDPHKRAEEETVAQENEILTAGQYVPTTDGQDHLIHLMGHAKLQQTLKWWSYGPGIQILILMHIQEHTAKFANVLQAMAQPPEGAGST
jgi:hypothetical protein